MMNDSRMSADSNIFITKPNNTLANILDVLTCDSHYDVAFHRKFLFGSNLR